MENQSKTTKTPLNSTVDTDVFEAVEKLAKERGVSRSQVVSELLREGLKHLSGDGGGVASVDPLSVRNLLLKDSKKFIERVGKHNLLRWIKLYETRFNGVNVTPENFPQVDAIVARMFREVNSVGLTVSEMADFKEWMELMKKTAEVEEKIMRETLEAADKTAHITPVRSTVKPDAPDVQAVPIETTATSGPKPKGKLILEKRGDDNWYWYDKYRDPETGKWKKDYFGVATPEEVKEWLERKANLNSTTAIMLYKPTVSLVPMPAQ